MYGVRCMAYVNESERVIRVLTNKEIDRGEWSRLVQTSATGTWFQTPEAFEFFESMPELFRPFVIGVASNLPSLQGRGGDRLLLRAICVGYVTVERNPIKQYFTRRAIIIGGPALADDATDEEVVALLEAVKEKASLQLSPVGKRDTAQEPSHLGCFKGRLCSLLLGRDGVGSPIYIETRNFNDYSRWKGAFENAGFEYKKHLNFHVDCTDKEQMWERLSKTRQKQIRRALRSGVEVIEPVEEDVKKWYAILQEMYRQKVKLPLLPMDFFLNAYRSGNAKYLMVKYNGEVIGGLMFEVDEKSVYEWYVCGLDSVYERQYPSVVATYAGMEYANAHGRRCCDLMGAGEPGVPYGVRDFKERFGGELVEHGRFVCVREPILYKIGVLGVKMMRG